MEVRKGGFVLSYVKVLGELNKGKLAPLYLIYGSETYLLEDTIHRIISAGLSIEEQEFNLSKFDMGEYPVEMAVEEAYTFPFMGQRRVVLIKEAVFFSGQKDSKKVEHDMDKLLKYIEEPAPETVFIVHAPYEKLDERKKLVKQMKKQAIVMEGAPLKEKELHQWIEEKARQEQVEFEAEARTELMALTGANLMQMGSEIRKLATHVGENNNVTREHVSSLVARSLEQDIFVLVDGVVKGQAHQSMKVFKDLLKQKEPPLRIMAMMVRQFRILYQIKQLTQQGYGEKMIASQLKLHPYVVKLAAKQVQRFQDKELLSYLDQLADLDYQIKTGKINDELGVELFLLRR